MAGLTAIKRKGFRGGGMDASTKSFDAPAAKRENREAIGREDRVSHGATQFQADNQGFTPTQVTNQNVAPSASAIQAAKQFQEEQVFKQKTQTYNKKKGYYEPNKVGFFRKSLYNRFPNNPKNEIAYLRQLKAKGHYIPPELEKILDAQDAERRSGLDYNKKFSAEEFEMMRAFKPKGSLDFSNYMLVGDPNRGVRPNPGMFMRGNLGNFYSQSKPDWWDSAVHGNWEQHKSKLIQDMGLTTGGRDNDNPGYGVPDDMPGDDDGDGDGDDEDDGYRFGDNLYGAADVTRGSYVFNQGGRVPRASGGIMDVATGRKGFFLGGIGDAIGDVFGGVAKAAGKVLKSDLGRYAIMAAGMYYGGGGRMPFTEAFKSKGFGGAKLFGEGSFFSKSNPLLFNADKTLNFSKLAGLSTIAPYVFGEGKPNEDIGMGDRGGSLIDPLTGEESTPAEMRANIDAAVTEADGDPVKLAAIDKKYNNMLNLVPNTPYPNYGLYANGGRIARAEGGLMNLGGMEKDYRAEGGFVPIGKQEKADDVPARLSVNEFVFTADAVRNAGGGDIDKGAEVMENMMKNLENGGRVSEESQGNTGAQDMFSVSERIGEVI